jgi:hypothetical protein
MSSKKIVFLHIAIVFFLVLIPVARCASDVTIHYFGVDKAVYERGDFVVFTLTVRNNALNSSHMIRFKFQILRGEIILWDSGTSDPQKLNKTTESGAELTVRLTYGPLDSSFSDDYYIFRTLVYADDMSGGHISENYGANVIPEFSWPLMILSVATLSGIFVSKIKPHSQPSS